MKKIHVIIANKKYRIVSFYSTKYLLALICTIKVTIAVCLIGAILCFKLQDENKIISYVANTHHQEIKLYYKNSNGQPLASLQNLKNYVESQNQQLIFAMNGGMYQQNNVPLGLYIENKKLITPLNTKTGSGNFYLKPNGVFYIDTKKTPHICTTESFKNKNVKYATQSGPMLIVDSKINIAFKEGSQNLNIRNGVGVLNDSTVVFAISKEEVNFYDFAKFFLNMGCKNALYLDGFVSRAFIPEKKWLQTDGNFGVMIGVAKAQK